MNLAAAMLSGVYSATRIKVERSRRSRSKPMSGERRKVAQAYPSKEHKNGDLAKR
jgi:hypothetical protein